MTKNDFDIINAQKFADIYIALAKVFGKKDKSFLIFRKNFIYVSDSYIGIRIKTKWDFGGGFMIIPEHEILTADSVKIREDGFLYIKTDDKTLNRFGIKKKIKFYKIPLLKISEKAEEVARVIGAFAEIQRPAETVSNRIDYSYKKGEVIPEKIQKSVIKLKGLFDALHIKIFRFFRNKGGVTYALPIWSGSYTKYDLTIIITDC